MIPPGYETALVESGEYFIHLLVRLVPLFIAASFFVGLAQEYLPPERVEAVLRERSQGSGNVAAAGLGAVTPFCSCSTVPVLAGLLGAGAPLGLAFSFLLASPIVNWIAVFLLLGLFTVDVTILYLVSTLSAAVLGGLLIGQFDFEHLIKDVQVTTGNRRITTDGGTAHPSDASRETTSDSAGSAPSKSRAETPGQSSNGSKDQCCSEQAQPNRVPDRSHRERFATAGRGALSFFRDTIWYLLIGILIGALIHGAVPDGLLLTIAGPNNPFAVLIAVLVGAPVYVSISGMLPIAAALADHGIPIGTVLAFVIGGAGISIPNLILLNALFERKLLAIYAGTVVAIGITVGVLFNLFAGGLV